eukprot:CAMPEP_0114424086 /NCGR_PEP_ID=MMETSP0103-20121206/6502_1 /TAXON_ID=37642 ORGANISM="Paraphysomonas imperforata, Strain PA2" /NCGR_SAMPLE_ID=MMETSP0103 /ASSEMBLY_ACC=CAM_ASM_000201 /LENGTH=247 /DNA_ID=CAMNT_0001592807 /DNA_START=86 /DNA_END=829 /DNA_ORIENTATION=-
MSLTGCQSTLKRPYLSDHKRLSDPSYFFSQFTNTVLKSFLLQGIVSSNKYTKHLEREMQAEANGQEIESFDEDEAKKEFISGTKILLVRNMWNLLVRKFYERIFVHTVDLRLADRLTKDVFKSSLRKLQRFTPAEAARRSFRTGLYASMVPALALFSVDCGYGLYDLYLQNYALCRVGVTQVVQAARWVLRRLGLHGFVAVCSAGGVACGVRCNWAPKYSTLLIAALCEAIGAELYNVSLGSLISVV